MRAEGAMTERNPGAARLILTGLIAPFPFSALVILQGHLQSGYNHVVHPISALAALPLGWVQNLNFHVEGMLVLCFAIGLHFSIRPTRRGVIGPALIALSGAGLIVCGVFPWRQESGTFVEPAGHAVGAVATFVGASVGHMLVSRRARRDPEWQPLASYILVSGIIMFTLFLAVAHALQPSSPLHPWTGALQRLLVVVWFACTFVIALRAWRFQKHQVPTHDGAVPKWRA
jgi:hypothetical membrane protein